MPDEILQFSAFISYASPDHKKAEEICASLEARGLKCWIAPRNLRAGHEYADEIILGIQQSRCLVLVLSEAANESAFVRREVERAVSKKKPVFPVRIEEILPSPSLELFVSSTHWLDAWSGQLVDYMDQLARALGDDSLFQRATEFSKQAQRRRQMPKWLATAAIFIGIIAAIVIGIQVSKKLDRPAKTVADNSNQKPSAQPTPIDTSKNQAVPVAPLNPNPPSQPVTPALSGHERQVAEARSNANIAVSNLLVRHGQNNFRSRTETPAVEGLQLKVIAAPDGQQAPPLYETFFPSNYARLHFTPACPEGTVSVKYTFDDAGYFDASTPQSSRRQRIPFVIEDWQVGDHITLLLEMQDGTKIGPFKYALPDREAFLVSELKKILSANYSTAIHCYLVPVTLPYNPPEPVRHPPEPVPIPADNPNFTNSSEYIQALNKANFKAASDLNSAKGHIESTRRRIRSDLDYVGCAFVTNAPIIACIPTFHLSLTPWMVLREIRTGTQSGATDQVIPVSADWQEFLKTGAALPTIRGQNPRNIGKSDYHNLWNALMPADAKSIFVKFIFRDGSESDEVRYSIDETSLHFNLDN